MELHERGDPHRRIIELNEHFIALVPFAGA
jgi:galactose-1-phosphate uridylyltransferase